MEHNLLPVEDFEYLNEWSINDPENELEMWKDYYWPIAYFYSVRNALDFSTIIEDEIRCRVYRSGYTHCHKTGKSTNATLR